MTPATWFLVAGAMLLFMALTAAPISRMPLSSAMVYLAVGMVLGPTFTGQFHFNPLEQSALLEIATEVAVLISLFGAGLKLAAPVGHRIWWIPFRLATISMILTVGLTALVGVTILGMPLGAAVLLGAVLSPTDPVLASDVQLRRPDDNDRARFALTGEAGLNDGTAFPMVMLGLALMGLHEPGELFSRWWLVDVIWATGCGLGVGAVLGIATAHATHRLGKQNLLNVFTENFVGLGLMFVAYGLSLVLLGYGFLSVFAAAFMLHRTEARLKGTAHRPQSEAPHMSRISLHLIEQFGRLAELALLTLIGGMFFVDSWQWLYVGFAGLLIFIVRPVSVLVGLLGSGETLPTRVLIAWFGVRGIGSLYYLMYAIQHGLEETVAVDLVSVVLVVVAISIVLHGSSSASLMALYEGRYGSRIRRS